MALAIIALLIVPFSIVFNAFVLTRLWEWFVTPFGIATITLAHAVGISIIVRFLTMQHNVAKEEKGEEALKTAIGAAIFVPLFAWGFGALAHNFMT